MRHTILGTSTALCTAFFMMACEKRSASSGNDTSAAGTMTATATSSDPDIPATGGRIPEGYVVQLDRSSANVSEISYTADGTGRWEARTGPAHILYSQTDTVHGKFRATVTIEQLAKPNHPEAYGIFFGGSALNDSLARKYTYFVVRGDGKYMVKVRDGAGTRTLTDWTAHSAIPKEDGGGKAVYGITVDVDGKTANISVNGKPVTSIAGTDAPLHGVTGVRINHNLHVMVTPLAITR